MESELVLNVDSMPGSHIDDVKEEMHLQAIRMNINVRTVFNGDRIMAYANGRVINFSEIKPIEAPPILPSDGFKADDGLTPRTDV